MHTELSEVILDAQPTKCRSRTASTSSAASSTNSSQPYVGLPRSVLIVSSTERDLIFRGVIFVQNDQKVGMSAFANKEKAKWTHS